MNTVTIKSPVGYVKHKSPSQSQAMVLEVYAKISDVADAVEEGHSHSTGNLFSISDTLKGGVVVAIRGDTGNFDLSQWEENSITLSLSQTEMLIKALQDATDGLRSQASLLK